MRMRPACVFFIPALLLLMSCGDDSKTTITDNNTPSTWEETIGGDAFEQANAIVRAPGGGYVIAGVTGLGDGSDVYLVKINDDGEIVWERSIGGPGLDEAHSITTTADGGYLLAGNTNSMGFGLLDSYLLKVDATGSTEWEHAYGSSGNDDGVFAAAIDDGYLLAGTAIGIEDMASNLVLVHAYPSGTLRGRDVLAESNGIAAYAGAVTADGGAIVAGTDALAGHDNPDVFLLRTDAAGTVVWSRRYGGDMVIHPWAIAPVGDDFVIAGDVSDDSSADRDAYVAKVDGSGNLLWEQRFGSSHPDELHAVSPVADGGMILAGWTQAAIIRGSDAYLVKTTADGVVEWERIFGGDSFDEAFGVTTTPESGFLVVGRTSGAGHGDFYVIKTDSEGLVTVVDPAM